MFVIEGMEKVGRVIAQNRKRKLTKHKKLSNYTIIEIDHCSPLELVKLQGNLFRIVQGEGSVLSMDVEKRLWRKDLERMFPLVIRVVRIAEFAWSRSKGTLLK